MKLIFILTVLAIYLVPSAYAWQEDQGTPYFAHPRPGLSAEGVESQRLAFLASEALHRLALVHQSLAQNAADPISGERAQEDFRSELAQNSVIQDLLSLTSQREWDDLRLAGQMQIWLGSYPTSGVRLSFEGRSRSMWDQYYSTWELVRLARAQLGSHAPRTAAAVLALTTYGAEDEAQPARLRSIRGWVQSVCAQGASGSSRALPSEPSWLRTFRSGLNHLPRGTVEMTEGLLGDRKTCASLGADVLRIVRPHQSPLGTSENTEGQLEGLSVFLAEKYWSDGLAPVIDALSTVRALDASLSADLAIERALHRNLAPLARLRLLALASHNHSQELYLQKIALELFASSEEAIVQAHTAFVGINHLYGLLSAHQRQRHTRFAQDLVAAAERPYHYWGGALVSCELVRSGYANWASLGVGVALGQVYEAWSQPGESASAGSRADVRLHEEGALYGVLQCQ